MSPKTTIENRLAFAIWTGTENKDIQSLGHHLMCVSQRLYPLFNMP